MKLTKSSIFLLGFYLALLLFWFSASLFDTGNSHVSIFTFFNGFKNSTKFGYIFAFAYAFIPLYGSIVGFHITRKWGFKSVVGKAVFYLSLSLLFWAIGEFIWSYYNFFLNANTPYPSWADVAFILTYPCWAVGLIYFGNAAGAKTGLHTKSGKILLFVIPLLVTIFSWYILVVLARGGSVTSGGGPIKVFFDIAYPVGDIIILAIAFIIFGLSFRYWAGQIKWPVIITIIGFLMEYFADFAFSYTTTVNTYYNGSWVDLTYATSLVLLSFAVALLDFDVVPSLVYSPQITPGATSIQNNTVISNNPAAQSIPPIPPVITAQNIPATPITNDTGKL